MTPIKMMTPGDRKVFAKCIGWVFLMGLRVIDGSQICGQNHMDVGVEFFQIVAFVFALPIIWNWSGGRMIGIDFYNIETLKPGMTEKLSPKHRPVPGPVPFRTTSR